MYSVHFGGLFALKQWISSSLKHDAVPRVNNFCYIPKTSTVIQVYPDRDITPQLLIARCGCFAAIVEGNVSIYNKTLYVWSLGKLLTFVSPARVLMFPSTLSRENIRTPGKQNQVFSSRPYIKCTLFYVNNPQNLWHYGMGETEN